VICFYIFICLLALAGLVWAIPETLDAKRRRHIRNGHPFDKSVRLDKLRSENHPHSDPGTVYTVNVMRCNDCGLCWLDAGLEFREIKD